MRNPRVSTICKTCKKEFSYQPARKLTYCCRACYLVRDLEDDKRRFWSYVNKTESCWFWTGALAMGYGYFHFRGKPRTASRLSYMFTHGDIPEGMCVLHNCPGGDDRTCVNPDHLWLGTKAENNRDKAIKGASAKVRKYSRQREKSLPN